MVAKKTRAKSPAPAKKKAKKAASRKPVPKPAAKKPVKKVAVKVKKATTRGRAGRSAPKKPKKAVKAAPKPAKKTTPKAKPATKRAAPAKRNGAKVPRRDGAGHLDPKYRADLRKLSHRSQTRSSERAFVGTKPGDDLAETLGEQVIESATTGEYDGEDVLDQEVPEERGGPFLVSPARREFADDVDESNPPGAKREPFPRA